MHCCGPSLFWDGCNETQILGPQIVDYFVIHVFSGVGDHEDEIEILFKDAYSSQRFKRMTRPYKFSIGAGYQPEELCPDTDVGRCKEQLDSDCFYTRITHMVWLDMFIGDEHMVSENNYFSRLNIQNPFELNITLLLLIKGQ